MMRRIRTALWLSSIAGFAYTSYYHSIELKGTVTTNLFKFLSSYNQKYSEIIFKLLTRFTFLKNNGSLQLQNKILIDFDVNGKYLQGLMLLGLGGFQIGPVCLNAEHDGSQLGIMLTKANIYSLLKKYEQLNKQLNKQRNKSLNSSENKQQIKTQIKQQINQQNKQQIKQQIKQLNKQQNQSQKNTNKIIIGVRVFPDKEVVEFAPYLIEDNIIKCINKVVYMDMSQYVHPKMEECIRKSAMQMEKKSQIGQKKKQENQKQQKIEQKQKQQKQQKQQQQKQKQQKQQKQIKQPNQPSPQTQQTPKKTQLIDFITLDSSHIIQALGQQNQRQAKLLTKNILKSITTKIAKPQELELYQLDEQEHKKVYAPDKKKYYQTNIQFITWKDLIKQIINS